MFQGYTLTSKGSVNSASLWSIWWFIHLCPWSEKFSALRNTANIAAEWQILSFKSYDASHCQQYNPSSLWIPPATERSFFLIKHNLSIIATASTVHMMCALWLKPPFIVIVNLTTKYSNCRLHCWLWQCMIRSPPQILGLFFRSPSWLYCLQKTALLSIVSRRSRCSLSSKALINSLKTISLGLNCGQTKSGSSRWTQWSVSISC